jgi:hypothetical protein
VAISPTHHALVRSLCGRGLLDQHGAILEIGQANWYEADPLPLLADIERFVEEPTRRFRLAMQIRALAAARPDGYLFEVARVFYEIFFAPSEIISIDMGGTEQAIKFDLNDPLPYFRQVGMTINHGTAEHIFNIAQVFRTMHDCCTPGGLMIHESPFTGWIDHGFYNLQPTLFFDLAAANRYGLVGMFVQDLTTKTIRQIRDRQEVHQLAAARQLPANSQWFVVLRKADNAEPFRVPQQGVYESEPDPEIVNAWHELR